MFIIPILLVHNRLNTFSLVLFPLCFFVFFYFLIFPKQDIFFFFLLSKWHHFPLKFNKVQTTIFFFFFLYLNFYFDTRVGYNSGLKVFVELILIVDLLRAGRRTLIKTYFKVCLIFLIGFNKTKLVMFEKNRLLGIITLEIVFLNFQSSIIS